MFSIISCKKSGWCVLCRAGVRCLVYEKHLHSRLMLMVRLCLTVVALNRQEADRGRWKMFGQALFYIHFEHRNINNLHPHFLTSFFSFYRLYKFGLLKVDSETVHKNKREAARSHEIYAWQSLYWEYFGMWERSWECFGISWLTPASNSNEGIR